MISKFEMSAALYDRATKVMVGGVSSPARAFKAVGGRPLFITRGVGSKIWDSDGNRFTDYVCSWGALVHGHSNPTVEREAIRAMKRGSSFGAPNLPELTLAEKICSTLPSVETVRFVNSGTEATMSAIRLCRAYTKRNRLLKFEGCYHGHADHFLTRAGSGLATLDTPDSEGIPSETVRNTLTIPYNDVARLERAFRDHGSELAAAIVEPVAGNMGVIPPARGFLESLRRLCAEKGSLLIFDEVITGFRVGIGGAQSLFGITPDVTCLGKIIGGGFPVGAYGASRRIMRLVSPEGAVYQAGTLSGNPVAMAAGLASISLLREKSYTKLEKLTSSLQEGLHEAARRRGVELVTNRVGSMLGLFFTRKEVRGFHDVKGSNYTLYGKFFWRMLKSGVYLPPSPFETIFLSTAHSEGDVQRTVDAASEAFKELVS